MNVLKFTIFKNILMWNYYIRKKPSTHWEHIFDDSNNTPSTYPPADSVGRIK